MSDLRNYLMSKKVEFKEVPHKFDGKDFLFIQPTQGGRADIIGKSIDEDGNVDPILLQNWSVIRMTHDENRNRVFEDTDIDFLKSLPSDSYVEEFSAICVPLMGGVIAGKKED